MVTISLRHGDQEPPETFALAKPERYERWAFWSWVNGQQETNERQPEGHPRNLASYACRLQKFVSVSQRIVSMFQ
ncbi:MAG TPA: hypothetical protein VL134_14605 [Leptolyngbya sp.]|nr:hypothetical protein [Leptolyngbya sp.]